MFLSKTTTLCHYQTPTASFTFEPIGKTCWRHRLDEMNHFCCTKDFLLHGEAVGDMVDRNWRCHALQLVRLVQFYFVKTYKITQSIGAPFSATRHGQNIQMFFKIGQNSKAMHYFSKVLENKFSMKFLMCLQFVSLINNWTLTKQFFWSVPIKD